LIDTLNKHFQEALGITRARSSGLQAAYFGAYPLASLGHANWLLRHWGYKAVFIWGLCLFGVGALLTWPALVYQSFGGFCAATFVIGNGLGSLETAANPYLTVCKESPDPWRERCGQLIMRQVDRRDTLRFASTLRRLSMELERLLHRHWGRMSSSRTLERAQMR
jgi:hypothetical protein